MGRQVASNRNAQKWQVAGSPTSETNSGGYRVSSDNQSEDDYGGSTRSPSTASGHQVLKTSAWVKGGEQQGDKDDRVCWADVESDGEEVVVFDGRHLKSVNEAPHSEDWSVAGRRAKNGKPRPRTERTAVKPEPVPARSASNISATSRPAVAKQLDDSHKPAAPYRPPKGDTRQAISHHDRHYDSSNMYSWEASSWGASGSGWKSSSKAHGTSWEEGTWDRKQEAHHSSTPKADSHKSRGSGKAKSESFKRGPAVATNMDASRLSW